MTAYVSQDAVDLGLKWYPGDSVNMTWRVKDANWSGTYVAKLRQYEDPDSAELATFTVTATYDAVNLWTDFTLTLSTAIDAGCYWWSCKSTGGLTRFSGPVIVSA